MANPSQTNVTELLARIGQEGRAATDELFRVVYAELRKLARAWMAREQPGQTLQPTALVHEAYLRLVGDPSPRWENRRHFFGAAAEAMRRILIERARRVARSKRGGKRRRTTLSDEHARFEPQWEELLAVDIALARLEARDAVMSEVVKLRYFAGLTVEETAEILDLSPRTVNRLWTGARAWLRRELSQAGA